MGTVFPRFWPQSPGPGRQPKEIFLSHFFLDWLFSEFRALFWPSSVSGSKRMAQKPQFG